MLQALEGPGIVPDHVDQLVERCRDHDNPCLFCAINRRDRAPRRFRADRSCRFRLGLSGRHASHNSPSRNRQGSRSRPQHGHRLRVGCDMRTTLPIRCEYRNTEARSPPRSGLFSCPGGLCLFCGMMTCRPGTISIGRQHDSGRGVDPQSPQRQHQALAVQAHVTGDAVHLVPALQSCLDASNLVRSQLHPVAASVLHVAPAPRSMSAPSIGVADHPASDAASAERAD